MQVSRHSHLAFDVSTLGIDKDHTSTNVVIILGTLVAFFVELIQREGHITVGLDVDLVEIIPNILFLNDLFIRVDEAVVDHTELEVNEVLSHVFPAYKEDAILIIIRLRLQRRIHLEQHLRNCAICNIPSLVLVRPIACPFLVAPEAA